MKFYKLEALGNDFILIDNQSMPDKTTIQHMADRHLGVGFDQLLWIRPIKPQHYQFRIVNADGSEVGQCGNGACAAAHYLFIHNPSFTQLTLETTTITMQATKQTQGIELMLPCPTMQPSALPMISNVDGHQQTLEIDGQSWPLSICALGNPHAVVFLDDIHHQTIDHLGPKLSAHPHFPQGCNIGFAQVVDKTHMRLRVYERGAGWTKACGSGACAAATTAIINKLINSPIIVEQEGGNSCITWQPGYDLTLRESATLIYAGQWLVTDNKKYT